MNTLKRIFAGLFLVGLLAGGIALSLIPDYDLVLAPRPEFGQFVRSIEDGTSGKVRGVYVPNEFAFPVSQGWADNPRQNDAGVVFQIPGADKATFLIAHDGLAGTYFYELKVGDEVRIVFGDGTWHSYYVSDIERYQVTAANDFVAVNDPSVELNMDQMGTRYLNTDLVIFYTCLPNGFNPSWGRLLVSAKP